MIENDSKSNFFLNSSDTIRQCVEKNFRLFSFPSTKDGFLLFFHVSEICLSHIFQWPTVLETKLVQVTYRCGP